MNIKRISLPPGSSLRRPPRALLGYASLDDTFFNSDRVWYPVADWRSWRHNEVVDAFRHAGVEQTGLAYDQIVAFHNAGGALIGYARVTGVRMVNASSLTRPEIAALEYNDEEYREFLNFENDAGWYITLERVEIA